MAKTKPAKKSPKKISRAKPDAPGPDGKPSVKAALGLKPGAEEPGAEQLDARLESVISEVTAPEKTRVEQTASIECPYCGEVFELHVSVDEEAQVLAEDCPVCSRSMSVHLQMEDDELQVEAYRS